MLGSLAHPGYGCSDCPECFRVQRPLLFGVRLWAAVCLALYVAFWLELDTAYWAGTSAARGWVCMACIAVAGIYWH